MEIKFACKKFLAKRLKAIGAGKGGIQILDRLALTHFDSVETVAFDTDATTLQTSIARRKVLFGANVTGEVGSGGNPDLAERAIEEDVVQIDSELSENDALLLFGGLGGGTAGRLLIHIARRSQEGFENRLPVLAFVTLPFRFEGEQRIQQAKADLQELRHWIRGVIAISNDALLTPSLASATIEQAFVYLDEQITGLASTFLDILRADKPLQLSFGELIAELALQQSGLYVCTAEAQGPNRPFDLFARLKKSPFHKLHFEPEAVRRAVLHVLGGDDVRMNEIAILLEQFQKEFCNCESVRIGVSILPSLQGKLRLTVLGTDARVEEVEAVAAPQVTSVPTVETTSSQFSPEQPKFAEPAWQADSAAASTNLPVNSPSNGSCEPSAIFSSTNSQPEEVNGKSLGTAAGSNSKCQRYIQPELPFVENDPHKKFFDAHPTVEEGEDLDSPTFLRWKLKIR